LNPPAEWIWSLLDGMNDLSSLRDSMAARFAVEPPQIERDMLDFVKQLVQLSLVCEVSQV